MDNSNKVPSEETLEENLQTSPTLSSDTLSQSNSNEEASSTAGDTAATASPELEKKKKKSRLSFKALKSAPKKLIPKRFKGEKVEDKTPTEGKSETTSIATQGGDLQVEDDVAVNPTELEFEPFANTEIREKVEEQQQEKAKKKKSSSIVKRFTFGKRSKVTPTADDIQSTNDAAKTTANSSTETELLSSTEIEDDVNLSVSEVSLVEEDVLESLPTTLPSPTTAKRQEKLLITITGKIDNSNEGGVNNIRNALAAVDNINKVSSSTANDIQLPVGINTTTTTPSTTTANSTPAAASVATAFNKSKNYDTAIISAGDYSKATTASESTLISSSSNNNNNNNNVVSDSSEINSKNQKDKPLTISSLLLLDDKTGQTVEKSNSNEIIEENITKRNNKPISLTTTTTTTSQSIKLNSQEIVVSEPIEFVTKTLSDVTSAGRAATIASTATATASQSQTASKRSATTEKFTIVSVVTESNGRLVSAGAVPTTGIASNVLEAQNIELRISENFEYTDSQLKTLRAKEDFMQNNSGSGSGSSEKQTGEGGAIEERRGSSTVRVQDSRNPYQLGNSITNPNLPGFKSPDLVVAVSPSPTSNPSKDSLNPIAGAAAGDDADAQSEIKFNIGTPVRPLKTSMVTHISEVISIEGAPSISEGASIDINSPEASGASSYRRRIAYVPQNTVYTPEEEELLTGQAKSLSDEISEISFDSATSLDIKMSPPHGDLIAENVIVVSVSLNPSFNFLVVYPEIPFNLSSLFFHRFRGGSARGELRSSILPPAVCLSTPPFHPLPGRLCTSTPPDCHSDCYSIQWNILKPEKP